MMFSLFLVLTLSLTACDAVKRGRRNLFNNFEETPVPRSLQVDPFCDICDSGGKGKGKGKNGGGGKPTSLSFEYNSIGQDSLYQGSKASCGEAIYPTDTTITVGTQVFENVVDGTVITIGSDGDKLDANTEFEFTDSMFDCSVHTSCSAPLVPGDQIGPFIVLADNSTCAPRDGCECVICDKENKDDFDSLTFTYISEGKNSLFQPEDKASCREGSYPDPASITIFDKSGDSFESFTVANGDSFTITSDDFDSETTFCFNLSDDGKSCEEGCYIHTSCSVPIVVGDQIGPLLIESGGDCDACVDPTVPVAPCVGVEPKDYCIGEDIPVSFNFDDPLADDWIGIYPCDVPFYLHAVVWQWNCGSPDCISGPAAVPTGSLLFDGLPIYNIYGPHTWPISEGCYRAVYLRNDGPSVPPYIQVCESESFNIVNCTNANST